MSQRQLMGPRPTTTTATNRTQAREARPRTTQAKTRENPPILSGGDADFYKFTLQQHCHQQRAEEHKSRAAILDDKILEMERLIREQKRKRGLLGKTLRLDSGDAPRQQKRREARKIMNLESRLNKACIRKDITENGNQLVKREIDNLRGHRMSLERKFKTLVHDLNSKQTEMAHMLEQSNKIYDEREDSLKQKILQQHAAERDKLDFQAQWRKLGEIIQAERKEAQDRANYSDFVASYSRKRKAAERAGLLAEHAELLEQIQSESLTADEEARLKRRIGSLGREIKKQNRDSRSAATGGAEDGRGGVTVEEAFDRLRVNLSAVLTAGGGKRVDPRLQKFTSGGGSSITLGEVDALIATFLEGENESFRLYGYLNQLKVEVEHAQEELAAVRLVSAKYEEEKRQTESEHKEIVNSLKERVHRTVQKSEEYKRRNHEAIAKLRELSRAVYTVFNDIGCEMHEAVTAGAVGPGGGAAAGHAGGGTGASQAGDKRESSDLTPAGGSAAASGPIATDIDGDAVTEGSGGLPGVDSDSEASRGGGSAAATTLGQSGVSTSSSGGVDHRHSGSVASQQDSRPPSSRARPSSGGGVAHRPPSGSPSRPPSRSSKQDGPRQWGKGSQRHQHPVAQPTEGDIAATTSGFLGATSSSSAAGLVPESSGTVAVEWVPVTEFNIMQYMGVLEQSSNEIIHQYMRHLIAKRKQGANLSSTVPLDFLQGPPTAMRDHRLAGIRIDPPAADDVDSDEEPTNSFGAAGGGTDDVGGGGGSALAASKSSAAMVMPLSREQLWQESIGQFATAATRSSGAGSGNRGPASSLGTSGGGGRFGDLSGGPNKQKLPGISKTSGSGLSPAISGGGGRGKHQKGTGDLFRPPLKGGGISAAGTNSMGGGLSGGGAGGGSGGGNEKLL